MRIYQVAREFYPYANAGGLKEVVTGISTSLADYHHESVVFIPRYGFIDLDDLVRVCSLSITIEKVAREVLVYRAEYRGVTLYLMDYPEVSEKSDVYTYTADDEKLDCNHVKGEGFSDHVIINALFQLSTLEFIRLHLEPPDVLSLHDGHTGLIPLLIETRPCYRDFFNGTKCFFTIHNAGVAYHQRIPLSSLRALDIFDDYLKVAISDDFFDPLAAAVLYSRVITVSPFYAEEILGLMHEKSSGGFGEFCNRNNVTITGITNGVNMDYFSRVGFSDKPSLRDKLQTRAELFHSVQKMEELKIYGVIDHYSTRPLFVFQNRITEQKGIDQLIGAIKAFLDNGGCSMFAIMGKGERHFEQKIINLARDYPGSIIFIQGYEEIAAKKLFISSDYFILTSKWEPCGLTDFEAQLAGSVPIVHNTGGLKKVIDGVTGFVYETDEELLRIIYKCQDDMKNGRESHGLMVDRAYNHIRERYTWERVVAMNYIPLFCD